MKRLFFYYLRYPHEILRMRMRMRMSKFMRISADADPDAELRYTSRKNAALYIFAVKLMYQLRRKTAIFYIPKAYPYYNL